MNNYICYKYIKLKFILGPKLLNKSFDYSENNYNDLVNTIRKKNKKREETLLSNAEKLTSRFKDMVIHTSTSRLTNLINICTLKIYHQNFKELDIRKVMSMLYQEPLDNDPFYINKQGVVSVNINNNEYSLDEYEHVVANMYFLCGLTNRAIMVLVINLLYGYDKNNSYDQSKTEYENINKISYKDFKNEIYYSNYNSYAKWRNTEWFLDNPEYFYNLLRKKIISIYTSKTFKNSLANTIKRDNYYFNPTISKGYNYAYYTINYTNQSYKKNYNEEYLRD